LGRTIFIYIKPKNESEIIKISKLLNILDEQVKYFMMGLTGFPQKDNPQNLGASYFEKNPIIPNINIYEI